MSERRPFSLAARLTVLLALALLALQVGVFAWTLHARSVEQFRLIASDRARLAMTLYQVFSNIPAAERTAILDRLAFQNFTLSLTLSPPFEQGDDKQSLILMRRLRELSVLVYPPPLPEIPLRARVREVDLPWSVAPMPDMLDQYVFGRFHAEASLRLPDGTWLVVNYTAVPSRFGNLFGLLAELSVQFLLQLGLAVAVIRYLSRPLRRLADFAERLTPDGSGDALAGLPEYGPSEVVRTSAAFRAMHARIRAYVQERVLLVASISHDLRSPLARLRIQLENEPALNRPELVFDALDDLQQKTEDAIALARTGRNDEPERRTDLVALLESLVADHEEYGDLSDPTESVGAECLENADACRVRLRVDLPPKDWPRCPLRPAAFRRCLDNLVDNALRYGERADIILDKVEGRARIRIEDRGPGVPEDKLDAVFQPFYRLEGSRNARTGGTGLGLGIARQLARLNHSDVVLSNRPEGGLTATLLVPVLDDSGP